MDILFNSFSNTLFLWSVKNKNFVIYAFIATHIFQVINILAAAFFVSQITSGNTLGVMYYDLGGKFGTLAALTFLITLTPGIAKRFGIRHKILNILMTFRRHFGIMTFLLVLTHLSILRLIPYFSWQPFTTPPLRELIGIIAFLGFLLLFITSNDFSTHRMGKWWGRLHSLSYIIVWLVFAHIALYKPTESSSILVGIFAVLEWVSLIYSWTHKKIIPPTTTPQSVSETSPQTTTQQIQTQPNPQPTPPTI